MRYPLDKALMWVGAFAVGSVVLLNLWWFQ